MSVFFPSQMLPLTIPPHSMASVHDVCLVCGKPLVYENGSTHIYIYIYHTRYHTRIGDEDPFNPAMR